MGLTDFTRQTVIARREIASWLQQEFWYLMLKSEDVSYGMWATDVVYTVPEGRRLVVEFVNFSCDALGVAQFAGIGHIEDTRFINYVASDFVVSKQILCRVPFPPGYQLRVGVIQRDRYKPRTFYTMIHGYTEPI
jgi:hypothetical protein